MKYRWKKNVDRTGKKCAYYINTNEILYQVSFRAKTSYLLALPRLYDKSCFCPSSEDYENTFQRNCLFTALTREIFSTLKEKFRVSTRPCNALCIYILFYPSMTVILYCSFQICPSCIGNNSPKFLDRIQGIIPWSWVSCQYSLNAEAKRS